jgi:hypothetical protein
MTMGVAVLSTAAGFTTASETFSLADIRRQALAYADALRVPGKPLGWYFDRPGKTSAPSLYASCDAAHMRTVMGEDLQKTLMPEQRPAFLAKKPDLHVLLGAVGAFGLLQQLLPETFVDDAQWTDILSDPRLYRTRQVEVLDENGAPRYPH